MTSSTNGAIHNTSDVIIIGGGAIGSAVGYGLARLGRSVTILDDGDTGLRAARGNAGLIWYQLKGLGFQTYSELCLEATKLWADFADELEGRTKIDLHYSKTGGIELCRGDEHLREVVGEIAQFEAQSPTKKYDSEILDRQTVQEMMPRLKLGQHVVGAAYCPHDGQVYTPALLNALHAGFQSLRGEYRPNHKVSAIEPNGSGYTVRAGNKCFNAEKVVVAAGLGLAKLGEMFGVSIPIRAQRGHIIVTEGLEPMLNHPAAGMRQTPAGNFLLGATKEWVGLDETVEPAQLRELATKWVETIPQFRDVMIIRSWAALRPIMPDGAPVYEEIEGHPGLFVMSSHSGISLASINASSVADWVANGVERPDLGAFSLNRFRETPKEAACSRS